MNSLGLLQLERAISWIIQQIELSIRLALGFLRAIWSLWWPSTHCLLITVRLRVIRYSILEWPSILSSHLRFVSQTLFWRLRVLSWAWDSLCSSMLLLSRCLSWISRNLQGEHSICARIRSYFIRIMSASWGSDAVAPKGTFYCCLLLQLRSLQLTQRKRASLKRSSIYDASSW